MTSRVLRAALVGTGRQEAPGVAAEGFDGSTALARGTFVVTYHGETHTYGVLLILVPTASGYLVDDFLYSILFQP